MAEMVWECPECGTANYDEEDAVTCPICGDCEREFSWDEVDVLSEEGGTCVMCGDPVEPGRRLCLRCKDWDDWLTWGDWQYDERRIRELS